MSDSTRDPESRLLRRLCLDMMRDGGRGHLASALSLVEILRVLYDDILRFDPARPDWPARDRLILSKGHGCMALYAVLVEKGFFPREELAKFCGTDGILGGHPEITVPGIEASTGSLGHGLALGIGMALAARYKPDPYRVYVILGDGESNEGSIWEGALCAPKHKLSHLTVAVDYNKQQSYDRTEVVCDLEPLADKWRAFGWRVLEVDGHDVPALREAFQTAPDPDRPTALICHTVKGRGFTQTEANLKWHHISRVAPEILDDLYQQVAD